MDFKELIDGLALDAGMTEPVAYDEDGSSCHLDVNDHDVGFTFVGEAGRMVVWTAICARPPASGEALLVQLLRANFMNQGVPDGALSLSEDDVIYAHCALKMPVYDKAEFYGMLKRFLKAAEEWREVIDLAERAKTVLPQIRPEKPMPPIDPASAFTMRV